MKTAFKRAIVRARPVGVIAGLIFSAALQHGASAQTAAPAAWPNQPIKIVVPQGPGGGVDSVARVLAKEMSAALKQPVIVENKPGASGNIGAEFVSRAAPDGYTLLMGINSQFTSIPHLFPRPNFNPLTDLAPVGQTTVGGGYILATTNGLNFKTVTELVDYAKKNPNKLSFGSYGIGSAHHLSAELLKQKTGIQMVHVPYKQSPSTDLIAGHIQVLFDSQASMKELLQSGSVKALAVTAPKRLASMPDLPTLAESYPGMEVIGWHGFWAPKGTPDALVEKISAEVAKILKKPEVQKAMANLTYQASGTTPKQLATMVNAENEMWGSIIKEAGIKVE